MKKQLVLKSIFAVVSIVLAIALTVGVGDVTMSLKARETVSTEKIEFVTADNSATFSIVKADKCTVEEGSVAVSLFKKYKEAYGVSPKYKYDSESGENAREIIIGNTTRPSTEKAKKLLEAEGSGKDCDYIICSVDDDIVIYGNSQKSIVEAGEVFVNIFLNSKNTNGIYCMYRGQNNSEKITVCSISELSRFTVVRPIYNVSYLTQTETDKLCELLYDKTGYIVPVVHDSEVMYDTDYTDFYGGDLQKTEPTEYEIIIGNCDRDGVKSIEDKNSYEIRIEETKIFLNGGSPYATAMAVSEFYKLADENSRIDASMSVLNGDYEKTVESYDSATYYRPTWSDDFEAEHINTSRWTIAWDKYECLSSDGKPCYRGSSELKNNYIEDGCLVIEAAKTEDAYYGGMLNTSDSMLFLYGYLEISDIHPYGGSFWTALWTVTGKLDSKAYWYSETDIDECFGDGKSIMCNIWAWPTNRAYRELGLSGRSDTVSVRNTITAGDTRGHWMDFHTYGFEWLSNEHVRFTVDGYVVNEVEITHEELKEAYSQKMYLKISMALGFPSAGPITENEWQWENTNKFIVDWIYLYQLDGQGLTKRWTR